MDKEKIENLKEERQKLFDRADEINKQIREEELKGYQFEGKYIYRKGYGYMFVTWQKYEERSPLSSHPIMFFQGWSCNSFYGPYTDSSYAQYDALEKWRIPFDIFQNDVKRGEIKEVDREELVANFNELCDNLQKEGLKFLVKEEKQYKESEN